MASKRCRKKPATGINKLLQLLHKTFSLPDGLTTISYTYGSDNLPRKYHLAIDYAAPEGQDVVAFCAGTVKKASFDSANGNFVIIEHTISSKTVYSFYAHLASVSIKEEMQVNAGQKIGVIGATGNAAGSRHLHFSVVDTLDTSCSYWGYSTAFTGNAVNWLGVVFYDPDYIIDNGMLPTQIATAPTSATTAVPEYVQIDPIGEDT